MTTLNATDCIDYIEKELGITLYLYQKKLITAWFDGKTVATSRGIGRTYCKNLIRAYVNYWTDMLDIENRPPLPDIKITYKEPLDEGCELISKSQLVDIKETIPKMFTEEFELKY